MSMKTKVIVIASGALGLVLVLACVISVSTSARRKYKAAARAYSQKQYTEELSNLERLSAEEQKSATSNSMRNGCYHQLALTAYRQGRYDRVNEYLAPIDESYKKWDDTQRLRRAAEKKTQPSKREPKKPVQADWGYVEHFGMITTVWISDTALRDKKCIARILAQVEGRYGKGAVWFFDSEQHAARDVPMTDQQMLHQVGMYDSTQWDTFRYAELSDGEPSPPSHKWTKTTIRPGRAE